MSSVHVHVYARRVKPGFFSQDSHVVIVIAHSLSPIDDMTNMDLSLDGGKKKSRT